MNNSSFVRPIETNNEKSAEADERRLRKLKVFLKSVSYNGSEGMQFETLNDLYSDKLILEASPCTDCLTASGDFKCNPTPFLVASCFNRMQVATKSKTPRHRRPPKKRDSSNKAAEHLRKASTVATPERPEHQTATKQGQYIPTKQPQRQTCKPPRTPKRQQTSTTRTQRNIVSQPMVSAEVNNHVHKSQLRNSNDQQKAKERSAIWNYQAVITKEANKLSNKVDKVRYMNQGGNEKSGNEPNRPGRGKTGPDGMIVLGTNHETEENSIHSKHRKSLKEQDQQSTSLRSLTTAGNSIAPNDTLQSEPKTLGKETSDSLLFHTDKPENCCTVQELLNLGTKVDTDLETRINISDELHEKGGSEAAKSRKQVKKKPLEVNVKDDGLANRKDTIQPKRDVEPDDTLLQVANAKQCEQIDHKSTDIDAVIHEADTTSPAESQSTDIANTITNQQTVANVASAESKCTIKATDKQQQTKGTDASQRRTDTNALQTQMVDVPSQEIEMTHVHSQAIISIPTVELSNKSQTKSLIAESPSENSFDAEVLPEPEVKSPERNETCVQSQQATNSIKEEKEATLIGSRDEDTELKSSQKPSKEKIPPLVSKLNGCSNPTLTKMTSLDSSKSTRHSPRTRNVKTPLSKVLPERIIRTLRSSSTSPKGSNTGQKKPGRSPATNKAEKDRRKLITR